MKFARPPEEARTAARQGEATRVGAPADLTLADIACHWGDGLPLPPTGAASVFAEPWQAHAFAMAVQLHARGLFTWPEWAATLSEEIRAAQAAGDADDGRRCDHHWLNALERLVIERRAGTAGQLHALEHAWDAAARRTPHGRPILLSEQQMLQIL